MAAAGGSGTRRGLSALGTSTQTLLDKALQALEKLQVLVEQPGLGLRTQQDRLWR